MKRIEMKGRKFGKLTAIEESGRASKGEIIWLCLCDCGGTTKVDGSKLRAEKIRSCGCLRRVGYNHKHGMKGTQFYRIWLYIRARCNPHSNDKKKRLYYSGRGISVCPRWESFILFKTDMYESYLDHVARFGVSNTTIDRIDVNGNYSPENSRWATKEVQGNNRRNNVRITYKGRTQSLREWSKETGIKYDTLWSRIRVAKLSPERALTKRAA